MARKTKGGEREIEASASDVDVDFYVREGPGKRFIEPRILFLLMDGPTHGYDLLARMGEVPLPGPLPDTGAVYRKLRAMEEKGLVVSAWDDPGSGPRRRVYRLTPEGKRRLGFWVEGMRERMSMLQRFLELYEERTRQPREARSRKSPK